MTLVLDASVVAKWLFDEPDRAEAEILLEGWAEGKWEIVAPGILPAEVASAIWKRAMRESLPLGLALELYGRFGEFLPILAGVEPLAAAALELAVASRHSVYDCLYVGLAKNLGCDFVTADEKLYETFAPSFPRISLLRNWKP